MDVMNNTHIITFDLAAIRAEMGGIVEELVDRFTAETTRQAVGSALVSALRGQAAQAKARLEEPFSLVVIGDFKRGKSTFINALLGTKVVTTNVVPETVTINEIEYGPELTVTAHLTDARLVSLSAEEIDSERLVPLLERLPAPVHHLRITAPVEWLRGIRVVDTPGMGDLFKRFDETVLNYLGQADAVCYLVSTLSPLSETEQAFLRMSLQPQDFPKALVLVNMLDSLESDEETDRLLAAIREKVAHYLPQARVYGISALDEFCRLTAHPRPAPERASTLESHFAAVRETLQTSVLLNRDWIHIYRVLTTLDESLHGDESRIVLLRNALQMDQVRLGETIAQFHDADSALAKRVAGHQQVLNALIDEMRAEAGSWMDELLTRLQQEAIARLAEYPSAEIQKYFHFFLVDTLRDGVKACLSMHAPVILEGMRKAWQAIDQEMNTLVMHEPEAVDIAHATHMETPWTELNTLEFIARFTPFGLVAGLLLSFVRDSRDQAQRQQYQQRIQERFGMLRDSVHREVDALYQGLSLQVQEELDAAYHQQAQASMEAMQQAQELCGQGAQRAEAADAALQAALLALHDARTRLQSLRERLSPVEETEGVGAAM